MKKLFFLITSFIFLFCISICSNASGTVLPVGAVAYQSKEDIPPASNPAMGSFNLVKNLTLYKSTTTTDYYYRVYQCTMHFSLPFEIVGEEHYQQQSGSYIEYSYTQSNLSRYTYETILSKSLSTSLGTSVKASVGVPLNQVTTNLETSIEESLTETVSISHTIEHYNGQTINLHYNINEDGYYSIQRRSTYKYYIVQKVAYIYNMKKTKTGFVRTTLNCYALLDETTGQFSYLGGDVLGLYRYIRNSDGYTFSYDPSYIPNETNLKYL